VAPAASCCASKAQFAVEASGEAMTHHDTMLRQIRREGRRVLQVEELDLLLDVPVARFDAHARRLAQRMRRDGLSVSVAGYRDRRSVPVSTADTHPEDRGGGFFRAEVRRILPLDRAEEFRMARRYEFLRLLVQLELERLGLKPADAADWAGRPRSEVQRLLARWTRGRRRRASTGRLQVCLEQLETLRNLYVEGGLHIVLSAVHRYRGLGVDTADLVQEGNASLFQAIEGFDWRRDVRFRTYAQYWVQQAILKLLYNTSRTVRIPIWVQKLLGKIRRVQGELLRRGREGTAEEIGERLGIPAERVEWVLATKRYAVSLDAELTADEGGSLAQVLPDTTAPSVPESVTEGDLGEGLALALTDLPERERLILRRRYGLGGAEPETLGAIAQDLGITAERVRQIQNAALNRLKSPARLRQLQPFVDQP
jgi:RNA polymerase primary sigma factor